jgi:two-component sensor histidine kinase
MLAALTGFAGVRSETQILVLLQSIMRSLFGAEATTLLTCEGAILPRHRVSRLTGSVAETVHVSRPEIEERLQRGAIFASHEPAVDLPGIPVPRGARSAVLVPCSSAAATNAVCAFWTEERAPFTHAELDSLRALATVAGLAFERQTADAQARLLRANLENRVRNVLAVIRSVGTRSAERAPSLEQFLLHFEGRIDAIGRSQIAAARDGEVSFELLLREELLAQTIQDGEDVSLEGMDVPISIEQAEALGLAVHELAVNAVKFGPFAGAGGSLSVRWWVEGGAEALALNIDWRERCALPVPGRPEKSGFGLTYLERALPFQLNAETVLEFGPKGLSCRIGVPLPRRPSQRPRTIAEGCDQPVPPCGGQSGGQRGGRPRVIPGTGGTRRDGGPGGPVRPSRLRR